MPRDRVIGWSAKARRKNIRFLAHNIRYLLLPWVRVENLASPILDCMARLLPAERDCVYGHRIYFLEG